MSLQTPPLLQISQPPSTSATPAPSPADQTVPETAYFSPRPFRLSRNAMPGTPSTSPLGLPPTSPVSLIKTPPTEAPPKHDGGYFPSSRFRSPSRLTRTTSPSDNVSNASCLSPFGGSYYSSDIGRSTCSGSSSEFLSPPLFQPDSDTPPYKPRRGSTDSLTMIKKLRRASTMPDEKNTRKKVKRHHGKRHKCSHRKVKIDEHQNRSYWWLPGCQVVPTAPRGQKDMCEGHDGHHTKSKLRNNDTYSPFSSVLRANVMPITVPRRWSSVEVGAHQIISELTSALRLVASPGLASPKSDAFTPTQPLGPRFRSSTFTRGAMDNDIVRIVRDRLTLRKIPSVQLKPPHTPASITLRRASTVSSRSRSTQAPSTVMKSSDPSGGSTPLARLQDFLQQRRDSTYLITSQDIDSITELIEENLKRKYERKYEKRSYNRGTNSSSGGTMSPTITSRGVVLPQSFPDQALTVTEAQTRSAQHGRVGEYLQVSSGHGNGSHISSPHSPQSVHEVIWQSGASPQGTGSICSTTDDDDPKRSADCDCSHGSGTPGDWFQLQQGKPKQALSSTRDRSDAFDPKNANASINKWSMGCPQNEIVLVVTSSDSESYDNGGAASACSLAQTSQNTIKAQAAPIPKGRSKQKIRPSPRTAVSDGNLHKTRARGLTLEDVVSFPPLPPRKHTEEWFSPLPEMITTPTLNNSRSLYDIGLDANFGPLSSNTVTPKASQTHFPRPAEASPPQTASPSGSIEFKPGWDMRKKSVVKSSPVVELSRSDTSDALNMRKKSVIKNHPTAKSRAADLGEMGSSIGSHCHERRRSSVTPARVQRVRTIDNVHKGEREVPSSKWRPPSVCPSRKPSSPSEIEAGKISRPPSPAPVRKWGTGFFDRVSLLRDRSPPQPAVDTVGIYGQLTGTRRRETLKDLCLFEAGACQPHDCDDCATDPRNPSVDWIG
ncbi:uncharacterized protein PAC_10920 [Phialocephala subalpina]|uniref:Uncharacterized protein n=1 Tax=Phialocephala subalpina TaxID=576137 RepID=A0A1L7X7M8_9HELO|nr:uncharacterized protein PAC_10920 [Phialocephala subalpina]